MPKIIKYGDESRRDVYAGIKKVADAVKVTMGPKGRNVILERSFGAPTVTNDGVTIAKEIPADEKYHYYGDQNPEVLLVSWGSTKQIILEALAQLHEEGISAEQLENQKKARDLLEILDESLGPVSGD